MFNGDIANGSANCTRKTFQQGFRQAFRQAFPEGFEEDISKGFVKEAPEALTEDYHHGVANQEQEQKQQQQQEPEQITRSPQRPPAPVHRSTNPPADDAQGIMMTIFAQHDASASGCSASSQHDEHHDPRSACRRFDEQSALCVHQFGLACTSGAR